MTQTSLFWTTSGSGDGALSGYTPERIWSLFRALSFGGDGVARSADLPVTLASGTATVAAGAALVAGIPYTNDANVAIAIAAATAQNRIDRVVLRATWNAQTVRAVRKAGTEGSLTPPTLTQQRGGTYEIPLAIVGASVDRVLSANLTVTALLFVRSVEVGNGVFLEVNNGAQVVLEDVALATDERHILSMVASGGVTSAMVASNAATTNTLADNAATNAKLADMAEATVKGRAAGSGTGDPVDLTAAQLVAIVATADGTGSGLDADTLDGVQGSGYAIVSHNHAGVYSLTSHNHDGVYSPTAHTHSEYAASAHTHTGYAALSHLHDGYATFSHSHGGTYAASAHTHTGYAALSHNHDSVYAATSHTHTGYATPSHNHDGTYAATVHTHTGYATPSHDHDETYSPEVHTHTGYALTSHNHDSVYAATSHTHSSYAAVAHNHDGNYSAEAHTHTGYALASHTHGTSTIVDDAVTNAKLSEMAEATVKGRAISAGSGAPADLTAAQLVAMLQSVVPARIFTGNTTISSEYLTEWIEVGNGVAVEVASTGSLLLQDGRAVHLDADTLDTLHASGLSLVSHTHSGYSAIAHTHSTYAIVGHTHSGYSAVAHTHYAYSALSHTHYGYSAIAHTHSAYSPVSHTHTSTTIDNDAVTNAKLANMTQATVKGRAHNTGAGLPVDLTAAQVVEILSTLNGSFSGFDADLLDGSDSAAFALVAHNHDSVYAATSHNHDGVYSPTSHTHSGYATPSHNHTGVYSPEAHNHNDVYAVPSHDHDATSTAYYASYVNGTVLATQITLQKSQNVKVFNVDLSVTFAYAPDQWKWHTIPMLSLEAADMPIVGTVYGGGILKRESTGERYEMTIKLVNDGYYGRLYMTPGFPTNITLTEAYTMRFSMAYV
jgi:hypothetical protein